MTLFSHPLNSRTYEPSTMQWCLAQLSCPVLQKGRIFICGGIFCVSKSCWWLKSCWKSWIFLWVFPKNCGFSPKMDGLFHGSKPYFLMDDLGVFPYFWKHPYNPPELSHIPVPSRHVGLSWWFSRLKPVLSVGYGLVPWRVCRFCLKAVLYTVHPKRCS